MPIKASSFKMRRVQRGQSSFGLRSPVGLSMKNLVFGGGMGDESGRSQSQRHAEEEDLLLQEEEELAHFWNELVADDEQSQSAYEDDEGLDVDGYDDENGEPLVDDNIELIVEEQDVVGETVDVDELQEQYDRQQQEQRPSFGKKTVVPHVPRQRKSSGVSFRTSAVGSTGTGGSMRSTGLRSQLSKHFAASSRLLARSGRHLSTHSILSSVKGSAKFSNKSGVMGAGGGAGRGMSMEEQRDAAVGAIFDRLDLDGDGMLDRIELEAMLMDAAATIKLTVDEAIIDAAIDALIEDATGEEAKESMEEISMVFGGDTEKSNNNMTEMEEDCINKAQFSDIFKRNPDMLRAFMSTDATSARRISNMTRQKTKREILQEQEEEAQVWQTAWKNWKITLFWLTLYIAANVVSFTLKAVKYANDDDAQAVFGQCIVVARGAAQCLNLNCALILLPMGRHFITRLRATRARHYFPFDHILDVHMLLGGAIAFWTVIHVSAHICDFHRLASQATEEEIHALIGDKLGEDIPEDPGERWALALGSKAGVTGIIMVVCILTAYPFIKYRREKFNPFWYTHHLLIVMLIALCIHGTDELLEPAQSVWWLIIPLGLYMVPRLLRETYCSKSTVIDAKVKKGGVLALRLQKPAHWDSVLRSGMYAFVHVPAVSKFEWHPFTLTSSRSDPFIEFHIRSAGDWTKAFHEYVESLDTRKQEELTKSIVDSADIGDDDENNEPQEDAEYSDSRVIASTRHIHARRARGGMTTSVVRSPPPAAIREMTVQVEGPVGASSQGFKDYPILVLVGAGIGVTPMISVLKELLLKPGKMERVFFYWTVRDRNAFQWFSELMNRVYRQDKGHVLQVRHFLTSVKDDDRDIGAVLLHHASRAKHKADGFDLILGQQTHHQVEVGRPKWKDELKSIKREAKELGHTECGIFLCGPERMAEALNDEAKQHNHTDPDFDFKFNKETF